MSPNKTSPPPSLSGSHVLITGGASGIGAALADACAAGGAGAVSLLDLDARGAGAAAALLREGHPGLFAGAFACDITSAEQVSVLRVGDGWSGGGGREEERRKRGGGREGACSREVEGEKKKPVSFLFLNLMKKNQNLRKTGPRRRQGRDRGTRPRLVPVRQRRDRALRSLPGRVRERCRCGGGGCFGWKQQQLEEEKLALVGVGVGVGRRSSASTSASASSSALVPVAEDDGRQLRGSRQDAPGCSPGDGAGREGAGDRHGLDG